MQLTDDAKAVIALTTRLGDKARPSLSPTQWHRFAVALADSSLAPADVFDSKFDPALPDVPEDIAAAVSELLRDAAGATVAAADLQNRGIWAVTIVDDAYPDSLVDRLGHLAPPVIFGVGPLTPLDGRGVGIVGSRDVSDEGTDAAKRIARDAVVHGFAVISGGARGVDQTAMNSAYSAGGRVVGVIADSLVARIRKPDILRAIDSGATTLMTHQAPHAGFTPAAAMGRNKLIYALSAVTVVIAADDDSGGTWAGAVEALKSNNGVVAVWRGPGEGPGNARLEELGAAPLGAETELSAMLQPDTPSPPEQLSLGDGP